MNNAQLYLAVAIPSVLVILSWINNNARQTMMDLRFDLLDRRFESLETKMERLAAKVDRRFDGVMDGMGSLRERVAIVESKQA